METSLELHLPDDLYERLTLRAAVGGRDLEQQLVVELERRLGRNTGGVHRRRILDAIGRDLEAGRVRTLSPPPESLIRADRDA